MALFDSFEYVNGELASRDLSPWVRFDGSGNIGVSGSSRIQSKSVFGGPRGYVHSTALASGDHYAEATINSDMSGAAQDDAASVGVRCPAPNVWNGYFGAFGALGTTTSYWIARVTGGAPTVLASVATAVESGARTIRLSAVGDTLTLAADGADVLTTTDTAYDDTHVHVALQLAQAGSAVSEMYDWTADVIEAPSGAGLYRPDGTRSPIYLPGGLAARLRLPGGLDL